MTRWNVCARVALVIVVASHPPAQGRVPDGVAVRPDGRTDAVERGGTPVQAGRQPLSSEARVRVAAYVSGFIRALANVVAQEDFDVSGRKVRSDFLLVQHPASPGDFLTYRDVTQVNGADVAGRDERLADLFLKAETPPRERVAQITLAAEQYVPSVLNPILVLAFLQADLQPRFELTEQDAGRDWATTVKSVAFVESARPTILRAGLQGERDLPVRGTAWIEPDTGKVLQTELLVPSGRSTTSIVTRFTLDQRLQIMVPEQMRTQNPNGVAAYSHFRRFNVATETAVEAKPLP
jgi:hypothetical protein